MKKSRFDLKKCSQWLLLAGLMALYLLLSLQNAAGSLMKIIRPVGVATALWAVFVLLKFRLFPAQVYPELWLYGAYVLLACVSGLCTATDRKAHVDMAMRLAQGLGMVTAVYALLALAKTARPFLWILLGGGIVYALYSVCGGLDYYRVFRQTLGNINANIFARVPMFAIIASLGLMNVHVGWKRLAFLPVIVVCTYLMLVSGSRTVLFACVAGVAMYVGLTMPRREMRAFYLKWALPSVGVAFIGGVALLMWRNPYQLKSFWTRAMMLFQDGNGSTSIRLTAIREAFGYFLHKPFFGNGAYQFSALSELELNHCHCDVPELLMAYGIVGTGLYALAGYYGLRGIVRKLRLDGLKTPPSDSLAAVMASLFAAYVVLGWGDITIYEMTCQFVWGGLTACGMLNRLKGPAV